MKKILSIMLSLFILMSAISISAISASAASQNVQFGQQYSYLYTDKNCFGTFSIASSGMVELNIIELPKSDYGSECSLDLTVNNGVKNIVLNEYIYDTGSYYMFLDKGTYNFNFYMDYSSLPKTAFKYSFNFIPNYNNYTNPITFGKTYKHYYSSNDCYNSFTLNEASTVTFTLTQPIEEKSKEAQYSYIYIYDMNQGGKEIISQYFSSSNAYNFTYTARLPKGSYKFNYKTYFYEDSNNIYSYNYLTSSTYKVTVAPAVAPPAPTLSHTVKVTKNGSYTSYDVEASFPDNTAYDGVELWVKKNNDEWKLADTAENSEYSRHTKVSIYVSSTSDYLVFYKVRAYSLYGTQKLYSNFSNVLYTKTTLKPDKPTIANVKGAKKSAKISWYKLSDVDGYVVYRSTKKKKGYKKVATIKKGSKVTFKNKKLKSKKTYYFKVRSFKRVNGVNIYSDYSAPKSVRVK